MVIKQRPIYPLLGLSSVKDTAHLTPFKLVVYTHCNLLLQVAPAVIEEIGAPLHFLSVTSLDQLHAQIGHVEVVHVCL